MSAANNWVPSFDEHVASEFQTNDGDVTMRTMADARASAHRSLTPGGRIRAVVSRRSWLDSRFAMAEVDMTSSGEG
jgi:hypothetical protein